MGRGLKGGPVPYANQKCRLPERADLSIWLLSIDRAMEGKDEGASVNFGSRGLPSVVNQYST